MIETLKKVNNALRIIFIGFTVVFALAKIFDVKPKTNFENTESGEPATSEFDEIW
jgi:hypothetical protein